VNVRVSPKGLAVCEKLNGMYDRHANALSQGVVKDSELEACNQLLRRVERFWASTLDYSARTAGTITSAA
jgi:hypothetical protein